MRLWRRRRSDSHKTPPDPDRDRQVWLRNPSPLDAVIPEFSAPGDARPAAGDGKVYADEIDPAWADPETAEPAGPGDPADTT
jgi:hypothetical protein